jgi:hypothetical protein
MSSGRPGLSRKKVSMAFVMVCFGSYRSLLLVITNIPFEGEEILCLPQLVYAFLEKIACFPEQSE